MNRLPIKFIYQILHKKLYLSMDTYQNHVLRVNITVKKIELSVRFQCALSFQLRADANFSENVNTYDLVKGSCNPNQSLSIQADFLYNSSSRKYEDKKIFITVFMNSSNGKVPAGTASTIITNENQRKPVQHIIALEKCPDKAAKITIMQSAQFVRKSDRLNPSAGKFNLRYSTVTPATQTKPRIGAFQGKQSAVYDIQKSQNLLGSRSKFKMRSQVGDKNLYLSNSPGLTKNAAEEHQQQYNSQQQKILKLQRQKTELIRELAKNKGQLHSLNLKLAEKQNEDQTHLISQQYQKAKSKIREYQRKDRQMIMNIRQLKQQIQKKKGKTTHLQSLKTQLQMQLNERDRIIKDLETIKRKLQQKLQDMNLQVISYIKKIQFKENAFKDQLRKMTQKYNQSQAERAQATQQMNRMISEIENIERKNQNTVKDRQRAFLDEKNQLFEKIQALSKQVSSLQDELSDKTSQLIEVNQLQKKIQLSEQEKATQIIKLTQQLEKQRDKLRRQTDTRKNLQQDVANLKISQEQRNQFKKKYNETFQQLTKAKQTIEKLSINNSNLQQKFRELEKNFKSKHQQKMELEGKLLNLNRDLDSLKKSQQRKIRQAQTMSVQNYTSNQKINELKSKLQMERDKTDELELQFNDELTFLLKQKQNLEAEMEQMKWSLEKSRDSYEELLQKMRLMNEEKLAAHKQNLHNTERVNKLNEQLVQLKADKQCSISRINNLQAKQKQLNKVIKQKLDIIYQTQKTTNIQENQINKLKQKIKHYEVFYKEKLGNQQAIAKEKQMIAMQKAEEITQMQVQIMKKNDVITLKEQDINIKNNQLAYMKEQINSNKASLSQLENTIQKLRRQIQQQNQTINNLRSQLAQKVDDFINSEKALNRMKADWDEYKDLNQKALDQFVKQITKDDDAPVNMTNISFPEISLSMLQVQAIKKRNTIISNYRQQINNLSQAKKVLQSQLKKNKQFFQERETENQAEIKKWKSQAQRALSQIAADKQQYHTQITSLQEKITQHITQNQKLTHELALAKDIIQQWKKQCQSTIVQRDNIYGQLRNNQEQIVRLRAEIIKLKTLNENELSSINEKSTSQQQKNKTFISDLQKRIGFLQRTLVDRQINIKKMQKQIADLTYQKDKLSDNVSDQNSKINNTVADKKNLEKQRAQLQRNVQQLNQKLEKLQITLDQQYQKVKEYQRKNNNLTEQLTNVQIENQRLNLEVKKLETMLEQLEDKLRQKGQKGRLYSDKYTQQITSLQQKIVELNSEIDLKDFLIQQNEVAIAQMKKQTDELNAELNKRKSDLLGVQNKMQEMKCQLIFRGQSEQTLSKDKTQLIKELQQAKQKVSSLEGELVEHQATLDLLEKTIEELNKTKQELANCQNLLEKNANDLRVSVADTRRQLITRNSIQQDQRRKIRELQKQLLQKDLILESEKMKWLAQAQRQRNALQNQLNNVNSMIQKIQIDFEQQKKQMINEINGLGMQCLNLEGLVAEKQQLLNSQNIQINQYQKKIEQLTNQLKICLETWDKQKTAYISGKKQATSNLYSDNRFQRSAYEINTRNKRYTDYGRTKKYEEQAKSGQGQIGVRSGAKERSTVLIDYKSVQDKINQALGTQ